MTEELYHLVGGQRVAGTSGRFSDVFRPMTGEVSARVPLASASEVRAAVENAKVAQRAWAAVNPQRRVRVLLAFLQLLNRDMDSLARILSDEHGKTVADAKGDVQRGLEVVEFACGIPHLMKGEFTDSAGPGIDVYSMRQPLGVVAGITPFNFPGDDPDVEVRPGHRLRQRLHPEALRARALGAAAPGRAAAGGRPAAGHPERRERRQGGGGRAAERPDVKALGFVGSTPVAEYIYARGTSQGKRVQCFGGAKNHAIIMPDADMEQAADALIGAGFGSAGERCMAISVAVPVGKKTADALLEALLPKISKLRVGPSNDPEADFGPMVTSAQLAKVREYVELGVREGAKLLVDGRGFTLQGYEKGFYMGPCLFDEVTEGMRIYQEEIFGPVLSVVRAEEFEEGLRLASDHHYGNGVAIFTRDGDSARDFASRVEVGMVGINVPIPVPLAYYTFGGWKRSGFGDLNQHGPDAVRFYTRTKTVTSRWPSGVKEGASFVIPTMG